jgi:hypothetical protein
LILVEKEEGGGGNFQTPQWENKLFHLLKRFSPCLLCSVAVLILVLPPVYGDDGSGRIDAFIISSFVFVAHV